MKIRKIEPKKFKTNVYALYLTISLTKENVTYNALIPTVLKRGCEKYNNQLEINKKLEEMYDATFGIGIAKVGNNEVLKFYIALAFTINLFVPYSLQVINVTSFFPFVNWLVHLTSSGSTL